MFKMRRSEYTERGKVIKGDSEKLSQKVSKESVKYKNKIECIRKRLGKDN